MTPLAAILRSNRIRRRIARISNLTARERPIVVAALCSAKPPGRSRRIALAGGLALLLAGCNAPPFLSSSAPPGRPPASAASSSAESGEAVDGSGWSGSDLRDRTEAPAKYHIVRAGETLSGVAALYGVSAARLLHENGLDAGDGLKPGQWILIPRSR
jgi:hypothetical protein